MRVGYANLITGTRLLLVAGMASLAALHDLRLAGWLAVAIGTLAACMDALDGPIARRTGTESAFGARFDMEVDSLLIMVLAVLAWQWNKAGAWVLFSGLLRYLFVAGGWLLPWLRQPLPPSVRRKTVCVIQIVGLLIVLGPIVTPPLSTWLAAIGLAILGYSFFVDTLWLAARRPTARGRAFPSWS